MVCLKRPNPFKFFKGCLPQNVLSSLLNTLPQISLHQSESSTPKTLNLSTKRGTNLGTKRT